MKQITGAIVVIAFSCGSLASNVAQASIIQSITIEEIGVASSGLGTSALANNGGWGNYFTSSGSYLAPPAFFVSNGTDGALVMGTTQGNGAISTGFIWGGNHFELNTLNGAPSGSISSGVMSLNLSGLAAEFTSGNVVFSTPPDASTLVMSVSMIDADHYFYTADWTHVFNNDVYNLNSFAIQPGWNGSGVNLHLEGIATTAVPEPGTAWLAGAALIGLLAIRHKKSV